MPDRVGARRLPAFVAPPGVQAFQQHGGAVSSFKTRLPSPALVVAIVALVVALSGSAVAATTLLVHTNNIANGAVTREKIANGAVGMNKLARTIRAALSRAGEPRGTVSGPQGAAGPQGQQGSPGNNGKDGQNGANGEQGPAGPGSVFNYEVDNGSEWALSPGNQPLALANAKAGYEDAGITLDAGPVASLSPITYEGSDNLAANVWISNGGESFAAGLHPFANGPADFNYYAQQSDGTYSPLGGPTAPAGCAGSLTLAQLKTCYAGYEAIAWVGVTSNGTDTVNAHVSSIDGTPVSAHLTLDGTTAQAGS
jgi:hypothetical protein